MGQVSGNPQKDPLFPSRDSLIGQCPQADIRVNNQDVRCLIDTGSQVTMFTEGLCKELFCESCPTGAETPWLTLRGANGLDIPYIGYIMVDFQVRGVQVPAKGVVIVKDHCLGSHKALLGMNVISCCWEELFQQHQGLQPRANTKASVKEGWENVFADCRRIAAATAQPRVDTARVACRYALTIPAHSEALVWARLPGHHNYPDNCVLIEPHRDCQSVDVARVLAKVQRGRVPVRVRNLQPHPVLLHRHHRLAQVTAMDASAVRDGPDVHFTEVSPGIVEVGVIQLGSRSEDVGQGVPKHLVCESLQGSGLDTEQQHQLQQFLSRWSHVFSSHDDDYGCTDVVTHAIPTGDAAPIRERYRPVPPTLYKEVRTLLQGMLKSGVIRESSSPWAAPIVLVQKKDGSLRFCVDYRKLNNVTRKDAFPLPRIEDSLTSLTQAMWYSTLDLASGYWQVRVDAQDREKTAFTTPFGLFEWDRMPFGLCNGPATFQRLMQRCLGGQLSESALVYLDDVILYSVDFAAHLHHLEEVFRALERYGLKLRPEKCHLFRTEVKFLGHRVSAEGVSPDPDKVSAVQEWTPPKTVRQVRSFLGFVGYYRRFIKDFSKIAKPLNELLQGTSRPRGRGSPPIQWSSECEAAFQQLKQELVQAPILAYADFTQPFVVYTDASNRGLGAVLAQCQGGVERVIAYASRSLHPAEKNDSNYSSFKLELLAMKWAVSEKFKDYLWGAKVTVITDNSPLVHLQTAKLGSVEQRWVAQLASFDYHIQYRPGKDHTNADVLSRLPSPGDAPPAPAPPSPGEEELLVGIVEAPGAQSESPPASWGWDPGRWHDLQGTDPDLIALRALLNAGALPPAAERKALPQRRRQLLSQWKRLSLKQGVICRTVQDPHTQEPISQIVVPQGQITSLLEAYHNQAGHQGQERTISLLRKRFYWPQMEPSVEKFIQSCPRCILRKTKPDQKAPLVPIVPQAPLHIVAMDFLTLSRPTDRYQNILVITDLFTKFAWAVPTADQTALTTAKALWATVLQPFGCPEVIHSDQGPNFESALMHELCLMYGCRKTRTTPYHPQGNGGCERFNQTLLNLLGTLEIDQQARWVDYLPTLTHAYNNSVHSSTGYAPTYLMFGRHVRLPLDLLLGTDRGRGAENIPEWVGQHQERLQYAYRKVSEHLGAAANRNKHLYDKTAQEAPLLPGERVLVRDSRRQSKGKLSDRWEPRPYVVLRRHQGDAPVYTVRPEGEQGPERVLHRNLLRPCPHFPVAQEKPGRATEQLTRPQAGWAWIPVPPQYPIVEGHADTPPRRSQRATQGRPPDRYGSWGQ